MVLFFVVTVFIVFAFHYFTQTLSVPQYHRRLILTGLLSLSQIMLTEIILGVWGILYLNILVSVNLLISASLLMYSVQKMRRSFLHQTSVFKSDIRHELNIIVRWHNAILLGFVAIASAWIVTAAWLLPPRGIDDQTYLPPIYEYIVHHKIFLLPVTLRPHFACPLNGQFLFMWPAIFTHSQTWIDIVQWILSLFGALVIYGLGRQIQLSARESFFAGLLFLLTPVVLLQGGSTYTDTIVNVFFLTGLFFALRFSRQGETVDLYAAGMAMGLLAGTKYGMLILIASLQYFIWKGRRAARPINFLIYVLLIVTLGGYFYIRNFIELGNPLYPVHFRNRSLGILDAGSRMSFDLAQDLPSIFWKCSQLYVHDIGLNSLHGGLGIVFWGIAFPCWVYVCLGTFLRKHPNRYGPLSFWVQAFLGFFLLMWIPIEQFQYSVRFLIFIAPIGYLALAKILEELSPVISRALRVFCVLFSFFSLSLLSTSELPSYRFIDALQDRLQGVTTSEFKYLGNTGGRFADMRYIAEPLDFLTKDAPRGLTCYMAAGKRHFFLTLIYGAHFQNRVWNLGSEEGTPDVLIFFRIPPENLFFLGKKITPEETAGDPRYVLILQNQYSQIFIKKSVLQQEPYKQNLIRYYEQTFPSFIVTAEVIQKHLKPGIPIIPGDAGAIGFRYLELTGKRHNPFLWSPREHLLTMIKKTGWSEVYTINTPLKDSTSSVETKLDLFGNHFNIYRNQSYIPN